MLPEAFVAEVRLGLRADFVLDAVLHMVGAKLSRTARIHFELLTLDSSTNKSTIRLRNLGLESTTFHALVKLRFLID